MSGSLIGVIFVFFGILFAVMPPMGFFQPSMKDLPQYFELKVRGQTKKIETRRVAGVIVLFIGIFLLA